MPPKVPTTAQVVPGALVNIVLKQDQPTGRTVRGIVQTLLTRGNHPRGIKVRLNDGRVGRVQSMADAAGASSATGASVTADAAGARADRMPISGRFDGFVGNDENYSPRDNTTLDEYISPGKLNRRPGKKQGGRPQPTTARSSHEVTSPVLNTGSGSIPTAQTYALAVCPICSDFEGDEAAVSHHVNEHFSS